MEVNKKRTENRQKCRVSSRTAATWRRKKVDHRSSIGGNGRKRRDGGQAREGTSLFGRNRIQLTHVW